ncbi:hypothetical protein DPMN_179195 [Dreissena polymorpha]|uniref:Uncharacterized protein n=1 Tax=Dreissena polymorpha TaxID=45954 RepID=A0A9D4ECC7_DREPO|nr:hypothetical protein DPMN_179195 [Dreissena polymorpha]
MYFCNNIITCFLEVNYKLALTLIRLKEHSSSVDRKLNDLPSSVVIDSYPLTVQMAGHWFSVHFQ